MACRLADASHYLNQFWNITKETNLSEKLSFKIKRDSYIYLQENAFENIAVLSQSQSVKRMLLLRSWPHSRILARYSLEWRHKGRAGGMCSESYTHCPHRSPELRSTFLSIADWLWCRFQMVSFERHRLDSNSDANPSRWPCEKRERTFLKSDWWLSKLVSLRPWTESVRSRVNVAWLP